MNKVICAGVVVLTIAMASPAVGKLIAYWPFDSDLKNSLGDPKLDGSAVADGNAKVEITHVQGQYKVGSGGLRIASGPAGDSDRSYVDISSPLGHERWDYSITAWYKVTDLGASGSKTRNFLWESTPGFSLSFALNSSPEGRRAEWWFDWQPENAVNNKPKGGEADSRPIVQPDVWNHVALIWDRVKREIRFYHNGSMEAGYPIGFPTDANGNRVDKTLAAMDGLHIGEHRAGDGTRNWDGYIDDLAVWDHALSADEVADLYHGRATPLTLEIYRCVSLDPKTRSYEGISGSRSYKVNVKSFDWVDGVSRLEAEQAAILAADTWNEQANAGYFTFTGYSERENLPWNWEAECEDIDFSLVTAFDDVAAEGNSGAGPRCRKKEGERRIGEQFALLLTNKPGKSSYFIAQDDMGANEYDLVKGVMHELGHTFMLGHPTRDSSAPQSPGATLRGGNPGVHNARDLWQWDIACVEKIAGNRRVKLRRAFQGADGLWSYLPAKTTITSKASAGAHYSPEGDVRFSWTVRRAGLYGNDHRFFWHRSPLDFVELSDINPSAAVGPREVVFREEPNVQWVIYSTYEDHPTPFDWKGRHAVRYERFEPADPESTMRHGPMLRCSGMKAGKWMECDGHEQIYSARPVAVTWDARSKNSVFAWVNQDRENHPVTSRQLMISVGRVINNLLPEPDGLGVRSRVGPAVACRDESPPNCILAYVDADSASGRVLVQRFAIEKAATRFTLGLEPTTHAVAYLRTGSSIAAWYNTGTAEFYVAVREAAAGQKLVVYSSRDGEDWSFDIALGPTITGPTAASYHQGKKNLLVWTSGG